MASTKGVPARGTNSELVECRRVDYVLFSWLQDACQQYQRESGDRGVPCANLYRIRDSWQRHDDSLSLWLLLVNGAISGYLIAEVMSTSHSRYCFIHEAWAQPKVRRIFSVRNMVEFVENWARGRGCTKVRFGTFRNPKAYGRLLGERWKQAEVYFEKPLYGGQNG